MNPYIKQCPKCGCAKFHKPSGICFACGYEKKPRAMKPAV